MKILAYVIGLFTVINLSISAIDDSADKKMVIKRGLLNRLINIEKKSEIYAEYYSNLVVYKGTDESLAKKQSEEYERIIEEGKSEIYANYYANLRARVDIAEDRLRDQAKEYEKIKREGKNDYYAHCYIRLKVNEKMEESKARTCAEIFEQILENEHRSWAYADYYAQMVVDRKINQEDARKMAEIFEESLLKDQKSWEYADYYTYLIFIRKIDKKLVSKQAAIFEETLMHEGRSWEYSSYYANLRADDYANEIRIRERAKIFENTLINEKKSWEYADYYASLKMNLCEKESKLRTMSEIYEKVKVTEGKSKEYSEYYSQLVVDRGIDERQARKQAEIYEIKLKESKDSLFSDTYAQIFCIYEGKLDEKRIEAISKKHKELYGKDLRKENDLINEVVESLIKENEIERLTEELRSENLSDEDIKKNIRQYNQICDKYHNEDLRRAGLNFIKEGGSKKLINTYLETYNRLLKKLKGKSIKEIETMANFLAHGWKEEEYSKKFERSYLSQRKDGNSIEMSYAYATYDGNEEKLEEYMESYKEYMERSDNPMLARIHSISKINKKSHGFENAFLKEYKEYIRIFPKKEAEERAYWIADGRNRDDYDKYVEACAEYKKEINNDICAMKYAECIIEGKSRDFAKEFAKKYIESKIIGASDEEAEAVAIWTANKGNIELMNNFLKEYVLIDKKFSRNDTYLIARWIATGGRRDLAEEYIKLYHKILSENKDEKISKLKASYIINGNDPSKVDEYVSDYLSNEEKGEIIAHGHAICFARGRKSDKILNKFVEEYKKAIGLGFGIDFAEMYAECILGNKNEKEANEIAKLYEQNKLKENKYDISKRYALLTASGKSEIEVKNYIKFYKEAVDKREFDIKKSHIYALWCSQGKNPVRAEKYSNIYIRIFDKLKTNESIINRATNFVFRTGKEKSIKDYLNLFDEGIKLFKGNEIKADMYAMLRIIEKDKRYAYIYANLYAKRIEELSKKDEKNMHLLSCAYADYETSGYDKSKLDRYIKEYIKNYNIMKSEDNASECTMMKLFGIEQSISSGISSKMDLYWDWILK